MTASSNSDNKPLLIVVLISGRGSNLQAIIEHIAQDSLAINIRAVISNNAEATGLVNAQQAGITTHTLRYQHTSREQYDQELINLIDQAQPDIICLAGFMRILSSAFVRYYEGRLINIHPSLLPAFKGLNTHQRALDAKVSEHGASVHFVNEALDDGPIIMQSRVPIAANDDAQQLATKVLKQEHIIYSKVLNMMAQGQISYQQGVIYHNDKPLRSALIYNE